VNLDELNPQGFADKGATLHLANPMTGEPLKLNGKPVQVLVLGSDSTKIRESQAAVRKERLSNAEINDEEAGRRYMAAAIAGWENVQLDGEILPYTPDNATLLVKRAPWIIEQLAPFSTDRANFAQNMPTS